MTFDPTPRGFFTIMGTSIEQAARGLAGAGADVIGSNCGNGIENMISIAREFLRHATLPVIIQSNAGIPRLKDGHPGLPRVAGDHGGEGARAAGDGGEDPRGMLRDDPRPHRRDEGDDRRAPPSGTTAPRHPTPA